MGWGAVALSVGAFADPVADGADPGGDASARFANDAALSVADLAAKRGSSGEGGCADSAYAEARARATPDAATAPAVVACAEGADATVDAGAAGAAVETGGVADAKAEGAAGGTVEAGGAVDANAEGAGAAVEAGVAADAKAEGAVGAAVDAGADVDANAEGVGAAVDAGVGADAGAGGGDAVAESATTGARGADDRDTFASVRITSRDGTSPETLWRRSPSLLVRPSSRASDSVPEFTLARSAVRRWRFGVG